MNRIVILIAVLGVACSESKPKIEAKKPVAAPKEHKEEAEAHEEMPSVVTLTAQVAKDAGIKAEPARVRALPETVSLTGEVIANPDRSAKITVRVAGRIIEVLVKEGDRVKKGQLLATIESAELAKARAELSGSMAKARSARQNATRLANVAKQGLASGQEVETAEAEAAALEAEARGARQTLAAFGPTAESGGGDAARLQLFSPIAGIVLSRDAVRGQTIAAEHVVASIADLDNVYFTARLFEKDLARIRPNASVEVRLNAYPTEIFTGIVETIGNQLDPTARTVTARIALANRNNLLKVGLFGNALVAVSDVAPRTPRVVVPQSAVTKIAEKDVVFVRQPDEHFEVHPVTLGRSAAGEVEILTGLRERELVVTEGVFTLKSAVMKSTFGEED